MPSSGLEENKIKCGVISLLLFPLLSFLSSTLLLFSAPTKKKTPKINLAETEV